ncbi:hypothetical protein [Flavobacterium facile]|uniref:hypothetical protein n=1 Tax=Flavobacterium facile TaxID=2893174 RepID=UPI002E7A4607|nr:hypothetical protein [Flavobacterium sp. T-12]
MQKNYVKYNVLMALAILFAICYQSLHIFTDEAHHFHDEVTQEHTSKTNISADNHTDCPVCDFQFAAFLSSDIYVLNLFFPQPKFHFSNTYESIVKEKEFLYFSHRGPPAV